MNYWLFFLCIDWLLFIGVSLTVLYMLVFSIASLFSKTSITPTSRTQNRFIILIPAYKQDSTILSTVKSVLSQNYPQRLFDVIVISDHQQEMTNMHLAQMPITLLTPNFEKSTKVKSLQYAILNLPEFKIYDIVIIIDGHNIVEQDFLEKMNNAYESSGTKTIVSHRIPKNRDTSTARIDSVFSEINNSIFRRAHITMGLSSSINGSGTAFDFTWFKSAIMKIRSSNTDKELEISLLRQGIYIDYMDNIFIYEEKARSTEEFNRQRRHWMIHQFHSAIANIRYLPMALFHRRYDLADKILQWLLIPRLLLIDIMFFMSAVLPFVYFTLVIKWWFIDLLFGFACAFATPNYLVDKHWDKDFLTLPYRTIRSVGRKIFRKLHK